MLRTFVALVPASQCLRKWGEEHTYQNYSVSSRSSRTPIVPRRSSIAPGFVPSFHCLLLTPVVSIGSPDSILDLVGLFLENIDLVVVPSCHSIDSNHLGLRTFPCICCAREGILVVGILVVALSICLAPVVVPFLTGSSSCLIWSGLPVVPLSSSNYPGPFGYCLAQKSVDPSGSVAPTCFSVPVGHSPRFLRSFRSGWSVLRCSVAFPLPLPAVLSTLVFHVPELVSVRFSSTLLSRVFSSPLLNMPGLIPVPRTMVARTAPCSGCSTLPSPCFG